MSTYKYLVMLKQYEPINVILAGKRHSHRNSTTSFSKNAVVAGTSYKFFLILGLGKG